jgi:hypothetical protein
MGKTTDQAAEIGKRIAELVLRREQIEGRQNLSEVEQTYRDSERRDLDSRISALRAYASTVRATSRDGALVQFALAAQIFDEREASDDDPRTYDREDFNRLVYSAVAALSDDVDLDATELSVTYFLPDHLDPWKTYEQRLEIIRSRGAHP